MRFARWDNSQGKGLDDLLVNGHAPQIEIVTSSASNDGDQVDYGTREDGRRLTIAEKAARYDVLANVLLSKTGQTPTDKLTLLVVYLLTGSFPSKNPGPEPPEKRSINLPAAGERVGVSAKTVSVAIKANAAAGLLEQELYRDPGTGHTSMTVAAMRPLGFNEALPPSEQREKDAARKRRCKECGSDNVVSLTYTKHTCHDCGTVEIEEHGKQADSGIQNRIGPVRKFKRARPGQQDEWPAPVDDQEPQESPFRNPEPDPIVDNSGGQRKNPEACISDQGQADPSTPLPVIKPVPDSGTGSSTDTRPKPYWARDELGYRGPWLGPNGE